MWQDLPRHSECQSSVCNLSPAHSWTFKGTPESAVCLCVCGCKGAQQWLEHVLTFILRNCARSPPKTTTSLLVFLCVCRSWTSSESGSKAKRCFEVVWKCVFQILSEIWGLPLGTLEYQSPRWSLRKLTGKISCFGGGVGLHLNYAHSVCCRKTNKIFLALLPKNTQSIGHKHLPWGVF